MTNSETKRQPTRQRVAQESLERLNCQPKLYRMADASPPLEKQFQFPSKVWDKLRNK